MFKLRFQLFLALALFATLGEAVAQQGRVFTLDEIYSLAEQNSKSIAQERLALREAEIGVVEAKTGRLPDIDLSLSASYLGNGTLTERNFKNAMGVKMPHFGNNFAVEAAQLIYGGGVVNNSIAMARLKEDMAGINLDATRSRTRFILTGFYLELYKLYNILEVYDKNILLAEDIVTDTKARNREGMALSNDITRQELRIQQLRLARIEVENSIRILNDELATSIGLPSGTTIIPDSTIAESILPATEEQYWQDLAAESAYDLRRGEVAVSMGERAEDLARAERRPSVALIAQNHFDGPITIEVPVIDKNFNYWFVGVGVQFKLGALYKKNRTVQRAVAATAVSRARLEDMREDVGLAIHADYIRYEEAYSIKQTLQKSLELAQSNYKVIDTRYRNDMALVTDMVDAANQLLDAELQLTNASINILLRYYKLLNSTGTL